MHIVVVYDALSGNTERIAEAIADGIRDTRSSYLVPVGPPASHLVSTADLLEVGTTTDPWPWSGVAVRRHRAARQASDRCGATLIDAGVGVPKMREWLGRTGLPRRAAVFDVQRQRPALFSGRGRRACSRWLMLRGVRLVCASETFVTDDDHVLLPGKLDRARGWSRQLMLHAEPFSLRGHQDELQ